MQFGQFLEKSKEDTEKTLFVIFTDWEKEIRENHPQLLPLAKVFVEANTGGKMLRAMLVKLGFRLTGADNHTDIEKAAAAFEIIQTAILAHDDIFDKSPLRRGRPSIYYRLGKDHYGLSQTVCLGDLGIFLTLRLIEETKFLLENKNRAVKIFVETIHETVLGEMQDLLISHEKKEVSEKDILHMYQAKTTRYTITGPLLFGAVLGGGKESLLKTIEVFGQNLGVAFQLQDDILGVFGKEESLGKSVKSDITEGKMTILFIKALERAGKKEMEILGRFYGKGEIAKQDLEKVKQVFIKVGALGYVQDLSQKYIRKAKEAIPELTKDIGLQKILTGFTDYLSERSNWRV